MSHVSSGDVSQERVDGSLPLELAHDDSSRLGVLRHDVPHREGVRESGWVLGDKHAERVHVHLSVFPSHLLDERRKPRSCGVSDDGAALLSPSLGSVPLFERGDEFVDGDGSTSVDVEEVECERHLVVHALGAEPAESVEELSERDVPRVVEVEESPQSLRENVELERERAAELLAVDVPAVVRIDGDEFRVRRLECSFVRFVLSRRRLGSEQFLHFH